MSDDDDIIVVKKQKQIHYGSLEEQEKARLAAIAAAAREGTYNPEGGQELGAIHISNEYIDLEKDDEMSKDKRALLEEFERRRKARQLNVSTDDDEVRRSLRQLGEPVCLFGEGPAERRARLRDLLSYLGEDAIHKKMEEEEARIERDKSREGTWYHEGPIELKYARLWLAQYSLPRARKRLAEATAQLQVSGSVRAAHRQESQRKASAVAIYCSQIGDTRPISFCRFSDDSQMLLTSSWSGLCKVWSVPDCSLLQVLKGHSHYVSSAVFHPEAKMPNKFRNMVVKGSGSEAVDADEDKSDERVCSMISCGYDGIVNMWNFESDEPIGTLDGHAPHRVARAEFHPSGRFVATCVYDNSWRLWDITTGKEVLHQEGHAKPVHCVAFQNDGSLAVTGGLDAYGRIWDLRTGRCVMLLAGHASSILSACWSPTSPHVATASSDHAARIWEMRKRAPLYTLPAHQHLISEIRYQRSYGHFLLTSSYDKTAKLWTSPGWQPLKTLSGHDNKVMGADITVDSKYIATCSYDRTFKIWAPELN